MRRSHFIISIATVAVILCAAASILAQVGQLRGHVVLTQADGTTIKAAGAQVDVFRTDLPGSFPTKTDKNGEFVYAGLPFVGTYIIAVSMPNANPSFQTNVKAGRETVYEIVLSPGDGRRLTADEAKKLAAGGGSSGSGSGGGSESAADKAKREADLKKIEEIKKENEKNVNINKVVGEAFKAGNAALVAKNYDEAIKQYDTGLAADADQPALLTQKTLALKARGVDKYNAAIQMKDDDANKAAKTAAIEAAKADFKAAADAANKAAELLKKAQEPTDPNEQKQRAVNKYATMSARAEAMRLFVTKADASQAEAGAAAFQDYIAVETDAAKKSRAQHDMAQMLFDAASDAKGFERALSEYQKMLEANPDDTDALLRAGQALFNIGAFNNDDKAKYQEASNYLQRFVDKAPDGQLKTEAKDLIATLKAQANVTPEKTTSPPRRKRP